MLLILSFPSWKFWQVLNLQFIIGSKVPIDSLSLHGNVLQWHSNKVDLNYSGVQILHNTEPRQALGTIATKLLSDYSLCGVNIIDGKVKEHVDSGHPRHTDTEQYLYLLIFGRGGDAKAIWPWRPSLSFSSSFRMENIPSTDPPVLGLLDTLL